MSYYAPSTGKIVTGSRGRRRTHELDSDGPAAARRRALVR